MTYLELIEELSGRPDRNAIDKKDYEVVIEQKSTSYPAETVRGIRWEHQDRQVVIEVE